MLPLFIFASMAVLGLSSVLGLCTNSIIIAVNIVDKAKGKNLSSSDIILVTLSATNIFFQFAMLANDYLSFLWSDIYFSNEVYVTFSVMMTVCVYVSFWFIVCLSVSYCLQIVIFTHTFLVRLKFGIFQVVVRLIMASVFISMVTAIPAAWNFYRDPANVNLSGNSTEITIPKLSIVYLIPSNLISCSCPLVLVGIANGLIIKSLVIHKNKADHNANRELNARAEARKRAARTIGLLLLLYIVFYVSEIFLIIDLFPPDSPGFCICLMVIYSYSPAQSIVLIFGSPKLKQVFIALIHCAGGQSKENLKTPKALFIKINPLKVKPLAA
ncbi:taste receptor type 2 member 40-like [Bombina bombina]|uniref:taste receptor type 2 member 40-like n=1 Tax=Bombina bombina TaxID=8345 RepID=UPI00235A53CC|nr:taste receptor type 2 member 40-like [Bombina bombina]